MTSAEPNRVRVSVAICTRDRPAELRRCLRSLQPIREQSLEIIVVDNNSVTDETRRVAQEYGATYVREESPGLSAARNRAIADAKGDVLAFTDDDCEVDAGWIRAIQSGFEDAAVGCVTGKATVPAHANWVQRQYEELARGFQVDHRVEIRREDIGKAYLRAGYGVGANTAMRRDALERLGGFPARLGAAGDDKYVFFRIVDAGFTLQYRPDSVVFQQHRDTVMQQLSRHFSYGIAIPRWVGLAAAEKSDLSAYFYNLYLVLSRTPALSLSRLLQGKPIQALFLASEYLGVIAGLLFHRNFRADWGVRAGADSLAHQ